MSQQYDTDVVKEEHFTPVIVGAELSHGTLESINLARARPLYEDTFGLRVVRHVKIGQLIAGRSEFVAVSIAAGSTFAEQSSEYRWLVLLPDGEELKSCYLKAEAALAEGQLKQLKAIEPSRGAESFVAQDLDGNWWEISNLSPQHFQSMFAETGSRLS